MASRYEPPTDRASAIELVIAAFATAAPARVNTHPEATMTQAVCSLLLLGAREDEIRAAFTATGAPLPGQLL